MFALAAVVLLLAWFALWAVKELPQHIDELDGTSMLVSIVFQRILPAFQNCEQSYSSLDGKRSFLRVLSQSANFLDGAFHPELLQAQSMDIQIPVAEGTHSMKLRLYWDGRPDRHTKRPVMVWFHGGGWLSGDIDQDDTICKRFALASNYLVVNVDYRLSPETVYPTAIDDGFAALEWVGKHIEEYSGDRGRVVVGGESAGGHLAAAVAIKHIESVNATNSEAQLKSLLLVYPALDFSSEPHPPLSTVTGMLPLGHIEYMRQTFGGENYSELKQDYLFAPLQAPDHILRKFPPTVMVLAKHDVLAAEGLAFGNKLTNLGVDVVTQLYNKSIHIFFGRWPFSEGLTALASSVVALEKYL
jgi:acetyl esterase